MQITFLEHDNWILFLYSFFPQLCETEKNLSDLYRQIDKKEQSLFAEFSIAINASYEKEKLHTNFIKVISILGTVASSFIALIFSIFMHTYQQRMFFNQRSLDDSVIKSVKQLEDKVSDLLEELHNKEQLRNKQIESKESWASFLHRYTRWTYSWALKSTWRFIYVCVYACKLYYLF